MSLTRKSLTRVTCARHVAPILRTELEALDQDIRSEDATGVDLSASLLDCLTLNLRLRTASHILHRLTHFRCPSPKALYTHAAAYAWEALIPPAAYFSITSTVDNPKIDNSLYATRVLKDAIVDRITKRTGDRPDSGPDKSGIVLHLHWKGDRATVYLNTTGITLADRGYRRIPHAAPMRETLGAAVLLAAGYDGTTPLINPMCGAGTLAIEAALIATGRAPGLLRTNYSVLSTALDVSDAWQQARHDARKPHPPADRSTLPPIIATDHDPTAIDAARKNAKVAGVDHLITFDTCDFTETPVPDTPGHVIMNPEYGERMGSTEALAETYAHIGDFLKRSCAGHTGHIFTASRALAGKIGLRAARKRPFMNAKLECRLLTYELYEGSRDNAG